MQNEKRRESRKSCELSVEISLRNIKDGSETRSVSGVLFDFTSRGARLIVNQVLIGDRHLFLSPLNKPNLVMVVSTIFHDEKTSTDKEIKVCAKPIWFDRLFIDGDESHPFWIGVEFLAPTDDESVLHLLAMGRAKEAKKEHWLHRIRNMIRSKF